MSRTMPSRTIPIVMDAGALSEAAKSRTDAHDHAGDPGQPLPGPAPVNLWVGDTAISEAEIAREMQYHPARTPQQARAEAARALVVRELLRREIARAGLAGRVEPVAGETREEAEIRALLDAEVAPRTPDEAACRRWYASNRERMHAPDRLRLSHILLAAAPDDVDARLAARELGERLIAELGEHPERFAEYAMRFSACPSKDAGGDLGWITRGQTTPEFERQVFMLREGLAGLTVESRYGHHVVRFEAIERGRPLTFEEAHPRIAQYLELQLRQNALHEYLMHLRADHEVRGLDEIEAQAA
ncbi:peptidylprolyl isomerase [Rehaibacterium terrae]|jgi:peptidyl-prolyl cis-trans isomerase C|uniref:peptidylprolyl isomerase n=1 Tax=Rehaibacterium terrae TaxID=1341696 RepID=A0A7W7Y1K1_9GAMM|nr:peptidylprolyl isomerase [Rehaibacterium terrae]MBB5016416.1 peptidyl-prolyl cis-trans isomerase C [Rehaibacterium terrae]